MKSGLKAFLIHFFVSVFFIIAALTYFHPVLQGKVIYQSDIAQYTGMAKEQNDFRDKTKQEPYWTNSAYGGMPTYQLGANYPHNYVKKLDKLIRFLPRPADYLFLYFIGFYVLLCCLKVDYKLAIIGSLAFGFSTYLIIILGVGHNAKAHALGYLPMVLGGIVLVFRKKYLWGFVLTAVAMALEIMANHYQMTYYFMFLVLILGIVYLINAIRKGKLKHYFISVGILVLAVLLGISANTTSLLATKEYADWSTRGTSELTINPDGSAKTNTDGLSKEYITHWSYGITESLNLFVPRLFGGGSQENLGKDSKSYNYLIDKGLPRAQASDFVSGLPLYWGEQPGTSAPAYIGAIIFFLFILGLFLVDKKAKWWLLGGALISLMLSWGKNFSTLTDFMIDYFPLYDKFRAVSSAQVILELCVPVLAVLALKQVFSTKVNLKKKTNALKYSVFTVVGICALLFIAKGSFDFVGASDEGLRMRGLEELPDMIKLDRKAVYSSDLIRSLIYILLTAGSLWFFIKGKLKANIAILLIGLFIVSDLVGVNLRYVNEADFVSKRVMTQPFPETAVHKEILKDKSEYRVFNRAEGFNSARTSYFHQSITGYHAAKPRAMQDLFEFYVYKRNRGVLNMLNVKYVIEQDENRKSYPVINPEANGNAWFIKNLKQVNSANEEILALENLDTKNEAVVNISSNSNLHKFEFVKDSTAQISLIAYQPNELVYTSKNTHEGLAVFSEMHYPEGWYARIDGNIVEHFEVNYTLRALKIPAGEHTVVFSFTPEVVKLGSKITLASSILLVLIVISGIGFSFWRNRKKKV